MRVFVTGATGFVGSAIVRELISGGHQVLGLARSDDGAKMLVAAGAEVHRGNLEDFASLQSGVRAADAVIHTGFNHDFSKFAANCEADRHVIEAMGAVLVGSNHPFIITSGIAILPQGRLAKERDMPDTGPSAHPRAATEQAAASMLAKGVNVQVVRLPPSVHDKGDHGFVPMLIGIAREKSVAAYIGEGNNRWPAVHRQDAAQLYKLALEKGTSGARYHAAGEEGVTFRDITNAIGNGLSLPVLSQSKEEAALNFGWFAHFAGLDIPASSQQTKDELGWQPKETGLIADMEQNYFG